VLRVDKSVQYEPYANCTVPLKEKLSCPRCHFTTTHGPALASHLTTHRILGIDLVDEGQHRLDGLDITFQMPGNRFPGIPSDVICCVYAMIRDLEAQPKPTKPRQAGSKGSTIRKPYTAAFKHRVLTALGQKRRYCPSMADTRIAERYGINKSLLTRWLSQEAEIANASRSRDRRNTTRAKKASRNSKYKVTEEALIADFDIARKAGMKCGPRWLIRNGRRLIKDCTFLSYYCLVVYNRPLIIMLLLRNFNQIWLTSRSSTQAGCVGFAKGTDCLLSEKPTKNAFRSVKEFPY
jgi:hypothetical protein